MNETDYGAVIFSGREGSESLSVFCNQTNDNWSPNTHHQQIISGDSILLIGGLMIL